MTVSNPRSMEEKADCLIYSLMWHFARRKIMHLTAFSVLQMCSSLMKFGVTNCSSSSEMPETSSWKSEGKKHCKMCACEHWFSSQRTSLSCPWAGVWHDSEHQCSGLTDRTWVMLETGQRQPGKYQLLAVFTEKPSSMKCYWLSFTLAGHGSRGERFSSRQERGRFFTFCLSPYEQNCKVRINIAIDLTLLGPNPSLQQWSIPVCFPVLGQGSPITLK